MKKTLSLKQRLIILFLLIGLIPFLAIGVYAYKNAQGFLNDNAYSRLLTIRELKKDQIQRYFRIMKDQAVTLSEDRMVIEAMREFTSAFFQVEKEFSPKYDATQKTYEDQLMARYVIQKESTPDTSENVIDLWWPKSKTVRMLQHLYISSNPFPLKKKSNMDYNQEESIYGNVHKKYNTIFRNFKERFKYYDIFLIDAETGHVVYTVEKELDFATSVTNGAYADTNLGKAFMASLESKDRGFTAIADYAPYAPSNNEYAAFLSAPIYDGEKKIGVIVFQLPIDRINSIMTSRHEWVKSGFGETGETYLVGDDFTMKTTSRLLVESPDRYFHLLAQTGMAQATIDKIKKFNSNIGLIKINNEHVKEALAGDSDNSEITTNYLGQEVLISHAPLTIEGVKWVIVAEMTLKEAFGASGNFLKIMIIAGIVLAIIVVITGIALSRIVSVPINNTISSISTATTEISATVEEHERTASQQAAAVNETTTTMDELGASARQSTEQAKAASIGAQQVLSMAEEGASTVTKMLGGMNELKHKVEAIATQILTLSEHTSQIEDVTNLVTDFANETKMLAMNASVEAVRAGEHGKGFSIVAMEIRKLADQSKKSAERIGSLVREIQKATNSTVMVTEEGTKTVDKELELAETTNDTFRTLASVIRDSAENIQQISLNVQQQATAVKQVVEAMNAINRGTKETSAGLTQTKIGIRNLNEVATELKRMV